MLVQTPAIILRCIDFQESSRIATLFTKSAGKVAVLARGAKKTGTKLSGLIETGQVIDVIYSDKSTRSVQTLTDASMRKKTWGIRTDFRKLGLCLSLLELVDQVVHDHEVNQELYVFTESFIGWLSEQEQQLIPSKIFPYLQLRIAELIGIGLQLEVKQQQQFSGYVFMNVIDGRIAMVQAEGLTFKLSANQVEYIRRVLQSRNASVFRLEMSETECKELVFHLDSYLRHHVGGMKERRSDVILNQLSGETS